MPDPELTLHEWESLAADAEDALRSLGRVTPHEDDDEEHAAASELLQSVSDRLKACHTQARHSFFNSLSTPKEASHG